jgi:hypothetical protein
LGYGRSARCSFKPSAKASQTESIDKTDAVAHHSASQHELTTEIIGWNRTTPHGRSVLHPKGALWNRHPPQEKSDNVEITARTPA